MYRVLEYPVSVFPPPFDCSIRPYFGRSVVSSAQIPFPLFVAVPAQLVATPKAPLLQAVTQSPELFSVRSFLSLHHWVDFLGFRLIWRLLRLTSAKDQWMMKESMSARVTMKLTSTTTV